MPTVKKGGKTMKFPYTPKGREAAKKAGMPMAKKDMPMAKKGKKK